MRSQQLGGIKGGREGGSFLAYLLEVVAFMEIKIGKEQKQAIMHSEEQNNFEPLALPNTDNTFDYNELVVGAAPNLGPSEDAAPDSIYFIEDPQRRASCAGCRKEVGRGVCVVTGGEVRCVGCFAKLQPSLEEYKIVRSLNYAVIDPNWKAHHEILFLTLLQKLGFGNWKEIKEEMEFFGARHSEEQLENHYFTYYLQQEDCLPKLPINESFFQKRCEIISLSKANPVHAVSSASVTTTLPGPPDFEEIEDFYSQNLNSRQGKFQEYFNERRNQFEVEFDNEAELLVANLEFREDDTEEEQRIKFRILEEYNRRLAKRNAVKEFVLEHRLLEKEYQSELDRSRNDYERQAAQELRPLARFTSLAHYNELVRKVAFTKQLKSTIEGLRRLRRSHPASYKSLDDFLAVQPQESKPRKKNPNDLGVRTGKKVEEVLEKHFKLNKKDFQNLFQNLQANGKKATFKNVEAVMLEKNY